MKNKRQKRKGCLIRKSPMYVKAVSKAYSMLVEYRRLVEEHPELKTYTSEDIKKVYSDLWCEAIPDKNAPFTVS